jgi:hypothetical protein
MGFRKTAGFCAIGASALLATSVALLSHRVPRTQALQTIAPAVAAVASAPAPHPASSRRRLADDPKTLAPAAAHINLWDPDSPDKVAASFPGADKSLGEWLVGWQNRLAIGANNQSLYIGDLESALGKCKLTPAQCVQLAGIARRWEDTAADGKASQPPYHPVTAAFARDAVWKASADVRSNPDSLQEVQATVAPLVRRLWYGYEPDPSKASPDLLAVREFYALLEDFSPPGSPDHHRGEDGRIETLILCRDFVGAESAASAALADSSTLSSDERADFAYLEGWSLYRLSRFADAVPYLRIAADRENCEKSDRAIQLLATSQGRVGDTAGMDRALKAWVDRFHPTPEDAVGIFSVIAEIQDSAAARAEPVATPEAR